MKTLLLTATALVTLTSAAQAGSTMCQGEVEVGPEWTTLMVTPDSPADEFCRFKSNTALGKRILAKCPAGSTCELDLDIANKPSDHRVSSDHSWTIRTIVKWPVGGVTRIGK